MVGTKLDFGGNSVLSIDINSMGVVEFADCSYIYRQVLISKGEIHEITDLKSYTIFLPKLFDNGSAVIAESDTILEPGDTMQVEGKKLAISTESDVVRLLISGVRQASIEVEGATVTRNGDHYKVVKPWGHELWLNEQHPDYCLKEVFIRGGNRTSLQYHDFKEETNIIFSGSANLVYQSGDTFDDLAETEIKPISSIHVTPKILHRIAAVEDTLLYETSTPHLDDIVRIQDDNSRESGRINSEHLKID